MITRKYIATTIFAISATWSFISILADLFHAIPIIEMLSHKGSDIHSITTIHWAAPSQIALNFAPLILFILGASLSQTVSRWIVVSSGVLLIVFVSGPLLLQWGIQERVKEIKNTAEQDAAANP